MIREAFFSSKLSQDGHLREMWEAMEEYFRILEDKWGKIAKLEALAKKYPDNIDVQRYLAQAYRKYDDHCRAAAQFESAAQKQVINLLKWSFMVKPLFPMHEMVKSMNRTLQLKKWKKLSPR